MDPKTIRVGDYVKVKQERFVNAWAKGKLFQVEDILDDSQAVLKWDGGIRGSADINDLELVAHGEIKTMDESQIKIGDYVKVDDKKDKSTWHKNMTYQVTGIQNGEAILSLDGWIKGTILTENLIWMARGTIEDRPIDRVVTEVTGWEHSEMPELLLLLELNRNYLTPCAYEVVHDTEWSGSKIVWVLTSHNLIPVDDEPEFNHRTKERIIRLDLEKFMEEHKAQKNWNLAQIDSLTDRLYCRWCINLTDVPKY